jgi:(2R)-3-sulfolactate dehydrogenase (NADP+)
LSLKDAHALVVQALVGQGVLTRVAESVAQALVQAEADGQAGHGLGRVPSYALHVRAGKVDGKVVPRLEPISAAAFRVNAGHGFAYPALDLALEVLPERVRTQGLGLALVAHSHHFGQAGRVVERLAEQGLIGLMLGNTPQAMAFWGGTRARMGTNPLAFACPLPNDQAPLVIDLALSQVARGKIVAASQKGTPLEPGWALDANGAPTEDAGEALKGTLLPIGGAKGAALALMVEILAAGLTSGHFGFEASSFFDDQGGVPNVGQLILALDPNRLGGSPDFFTRMADLLTVMAQEPSVRLPGSRRLAARALARREGLKIAQALYQDIQALGQK